VLSSVIGAGQFQQTFAEDNLRYDKGFDEDKRLYDKQFALDEAAVTGKYLTQGTQYAVQAILNAKQIAGNPSAP
ncbi:hypothetical protein, partial [Lysinibacillus fusiformis]|uniref:hypothetical protein n=1 Tax=Lysinibacillus fusiformis TaxID=28031 RepID=UPI0020BF3C37